MIKYLAGLSLLIVAVHMSIATNIVDSKVDECLHTIETKMAALPVHDDIKRAAELLRRMNPDGSAGLVNDPITILDLEANNFVPSEGKETFGKTCGDFLAKVSAVLEENTCQGNQEFVDTLDPSSTSYLYVKANFPKIDEMNLYAQAAWLFQNDIFED